MPTVSPEKLREIATDSKWYQSHQNQGSAFVEPELGARTARRFLAACAAGELVASDAWPLVALGLHHWNPNDDPRCRGFVNALAEAATAPRTLPATED